MREKNFAWLLTALLVLLVGLPIIEAAELLTPRFSRALLTSWLLIVGVWSLKGFGRLYRIGVALAVAGISLGIAAANSEDHGYLYASYATMLAFLLLAAWCTATIAPCSRTCRPCEVYFVAILMAGLIGSYFAGTEEKTDS